MEEDLDIDDLKIYLSMNAIEESLKDLSETNPEAVAYFTLGRTVGRMDITTMLMKIIKAEAKNAEAIKEQMKRKRG